MEYAISTLMISIRTRSAWVPCTSGSRAAGESEPVLTPEQAGWAATHSIAGSAWVSRATGHLEAAHPRTSLNYYDDISEGDDIFNGISGKRHHVVARYRWHFSDGRRVLVGLRHEDNDRLDPGVSPTRTGLSIDYRHLPDTGWGFEAGASYRRSRFGNAAVSRTENLLSARPALTRRLVRDWILLVEYRHSNNDSNDPELSYDQNSLTIGAMRTL